MALSITEISRYGRQLILPEWGVKGQEKIKSTSVLIAGAGGLGCPVAQYLTAAGIGRLGILDYDDIEISNLHRQILHTEQRLGNPKVESIKESMKCLNSQVDVITHHILLTSHNAIDIIKQYDIIVDATDNVATRYLLNDCCVLLNKPLVSGSALRFEGQLTVYHHDNGPCYRCLFPSPPPPHTVTNCSEGGVLGVIPGIIGNLQALEVLKLATGIGETYSSRLLMFDGITGSFRVIKLRSRDPTCVICGDTPIITKLIDYEIFCGSSADDKERKETLLSKEDRISCQEYKSVLDEGKHHLLLDVREPVEYEICHLHNSHNIPLTKLQKTSDISRHITELINTCDDEVFIYVVCRRGNDSQVAVRLLQDGLKRYFPSSNVLIKDLIGGLTSWSNEIDHNFPKY